MTTSVSQKIYLNHYLTESPEANARSLSLKAFMYNTLTKVSAVALIAIISSVLYVSYGGVVLSGTGSLLLAGMALSTVFFAWGLSQFQNWANHYEKLSQIETAVDVELKKIINWGTPQIEAFLKEQELNIDQIPKEALKKLNPTHPLRALLPMIARYIFLRDSAFSLERVSKEALEQPLQTDKSIPEKIRREQRYLTRVLAYRSHECESLPRMFEAARILELIQTPTRELNLHDLGEFTVKRYDERMLDRHFEPINDDYFVFHSHLKQKPLTLEQVEAHFSPVLLRPILFPNAIRA